MVYVQEFLTKIGGIQMYCHYYNTYTMHSTTVVYITILYHTYKCGVLNSIDLTSGGCTAGSKILYCLYKG